MKMLVKGRQRILSIPIWMTTLELAVNCGYMSKNKVIAAGGKAIAKRGFALCVRL